MRMKYGYLLQNFTDTNTLPVFRTESQDRMLSSALNFALGFFGPSLEGQYQQLITIEAHGYNNTLAPSKTCPNGRDHSKGERATPFVREWTEVYLKQALARLQPQVTGVELTIEHVYSMQQLCAYEVCVRCTLHASHSLMLSAIADCRYGVLQILRAVHRG